MLLQLKNLVKHFPTQKNFWGKPRAFVQAVNGVSLELAAGSTLGLVGESGCGKSTLGRLIMALLQPDSGEVFFDGQEITSLKPAALRAQRKNFQMIFQDPYASLNPRMKVGSTLMEPLLVQKLFSKSVRQEKVAQILDKVGLPPEAAQKYPHEFSGGQRQRIGIARALMLSPKLIVADEPVSALDVSIQAQILNLLNDLQKEFSLTYLFIAHDIKVVKHIADEIAVMYLGRIVERLKADALFQAKHPYTQALLAAVPELKVRKEKKKALLEGDVPSPIHLPEGCAFHTRCPYAQDICKQKLPELEPELKSESEGHWVACHLKDEISSYK